MEDEKPVGASRAGGSIWLRAIVHCSLAIGPFAVTIVDIICKDPIHLKGLLASISQRVEHGNLRLALFGSACLLWTAASLFLGVAATRTARNNPSAFEFRTRVYGLSSERVMTVSQPLVLIILALFAGVMAASFLYVGFWVHP
jgi:hypothetical protein